jgi:hypothetical protein
VRSPRRTVLIVIGAKRTESDYLKGLRNAFGPATVTMRIITKPGSPDQLIAHAREARGDYDDVWCVTDVDSFEREGGKITAALALAEKLDINVAVSDPCFELWLLLHHESCTAFCPDREAVERRLRKHVPDYDKTALRFRDFAAGLDDAIERARRLESAGNPSTGVGRLVSALLERT